MHKGDCNGKGLASKRKPNYYVASLLTAKRTRPRLQTLPGIKSSPSSPGRSRRVGRGNAKENPNRSCIKGEVSTAEEEDMGFFSR